MRWWHRKYHDPEIAPDEIFLDASNAPDFNRERFEGRLEKPLPRSSFFLLTTGLVILFFILFVRSWNIEITNGFLYAEESAHNSLEVKTIFAPRGTITDRYGVVLA